MAPHKQPREDLEAGLLCSQPKTIPCTFLYDTKGSGLYEQITQLEEYYPYREERELLRAHADEIVGHFPAGSVVVELGCGDGSKTAILMQALARRDGAAGVRFFGMDVSGAALVQAERNLQRLCPDIALRQFEFLEAPYLPGLAEARRRHPEAMLCILWLGSSVGNFSPSEAASFLADLRRVAGERSSLLLCTDLWKAPAVLHAAYDDIQGVTREFIVNGMCNALRTLGHPDAECGQELWRYEAVVNHVGRQVEMWVQPARPVLNLLPGVDIGAGERVLMEISRKFRPQDVAALGNAGGLCIQATWASSKYMMTLMLPPTEALRRCWADTDTLFARISDWTAQPIALRHSFGFYYGHITAFARLKMLPQLAVTPTDDMLSRGIDPNVLDPSECHPHPPVPCEWPAELELQRYTGEVRPQILAAAAELEDACAMHAVCMVLEHERMHQETLCNMLAQQRRWDFVTRANGASVIKDPAAGLSGDRVHGADEVRPFYLQLGSYLSAAVKQPKSSHGAAMQLCFVDIPGGDVSLGLDPLERCGFVWDNERGNSGCLEVGPLQVAASPVTVAEFMRFAVEDKGYARPELWAEEDFKLLSAAGQALPATWSPDGAGGIVVHMPEGSYHWSHAADCPAYVSLIEAEAYCRLHGGRIASEAEHQHLLARQDAGCPAAARITQLESGGWEWSSTPLRPFDGFIPDALYPEYSQDFFDDSHFVLRGSCPYTHPSIRRRSFRNFYQSHYLFMMAKFRVVRDGVA